MLPGPVVVDSNDHGLFNTVAPGTGYYVSVTDVNLCPPDLSSTWDFEEPDAISLVDVDTNDITCSGKGDGSITVNVTGGTPPYKYTLLPDMITQD